MSLTVFLAICILGCDVLIYFLYEWAFGESKRIRKRHPRRAWGTSQEVAQECVEGANGDRGRAARVVEMKRKNATSLGHSLRPNQHQEALAYRRLAASFASAKSRS
jgi:hypothetical protein